MSLHGLTPLKAVGGHGQPLLIVVKSLFCNTEHKPDAAVEGKLAHPWSLESSFQGTGDFYDKYSVIHRLQTIRNSARKCRMVSVGHSGYFPVEGLIVNSPVSKSYIISFFLPSCSQML